jgi:hypothetical protein
MHRRQEQRDQQPDDRDDHQQLDQGEAPPPRRRRPPDAPGPQESADGDDRDQPQDQPGPRTPAGHSRAQEADQAIRADAEPLEAHVQPIGRIPRVDLQRDLRDPGRAEGDRSDLGQLASSFGPEQRQRLT